MEIHEKITGVILGVLILCFAPLANATNEHSVKAEHFSMLDLNKKLSALILEKYPNAHVDSDAFSINAYNLQRMKDAPNKNHSCLDPSVKPRPNSADFKLHLSVGFDAAHQQQFLYTSGSFVVSKSSLGKRYDFKIFPEQDQSVSDVPFDYWTYKAYWDIVIAGVAEYIHPQTGPALLHLTRYEFAVAIARLLDKKSERVKDTPEVKELIAELAVEFAPEFAYLSMRGGGLDSKDEGSSQPRYEFLQLQFHSGNKFDKKLQKQIEDTITDYTATWIKSNSSVDAATPK
jgi:hypothetical protein